MLHIPDSIQSWAIIGPPAKRHLNGVLLMDGLWHTFYSYYLAARNVYL